MRCMPGPGCVGRLLIFLICLSCRGRLRMRTLRQRETLTGPRGLLQRMFPPGSPAVIFAPGLALGW